MFKDLEPHATHQLTKKPFFRQCDLCGKTTNNEEIEAACTVSPAARIAELEAAVNLYSVWAQQTGDYPHDEQGCEAHQAILDVADAGLHKQRFSRA